MDCDEVHGLMAPLSAPQSTLPRKVVYVIDQFADQAGLP